MKALTRIAASLLICSHVILPIIGDFLQESSALTASHYIVAKVLEGGKI